jgi:hypothetical protein
MYLSMHVRILIAIEQGRAPARDGDCRVCAHTYQVNGLARSAFLVSATATKLNRSRHRLAADRDDVEVVQLG